MDLSRPLPPTTSLRRRALSASVVLWASWSLLQPAQAADTIESYGRGSPAFEAYAGVDGLGAGGDGALSLEGLAGYGLTEQISAYVWASGQTNGKLRSPAGAASLGAFGTALDTDHLDLDVLLDVGYADGDWIFTPGLELNLDARPDLACAGLYLRAGEELLGSGDRATALTFGANVALAPGHQLLAEYDFAFLHDDDPETEAVEQGAAVLGYNAQLLERLELITQVSLDVPGEGEDLAFGFLAGVLVILPP